eukprot:7033645-Pyramimonas_sp.AAC.1
MAPSQHYLGVAPGVPQDGPRRAPRAPRTAPKTAPGTPRDGPAALETASHRWLRGLIFFNSGVRIAPGSALADDGKRLRGARSELDVLPESVTYLRMFLLYGLAGSTGSRTGGLPAWRFRWRHPHQIECSQHRILHK